MTGWDILNNLMTTFPPVAALLLLSGATVMFIVGFGKYGVDFIKHGFKQNILGDLLDKLATKEDISRLDAKMEANISRLDAKIEANIDRLDAKMELIEVNHFGHLKDFLSELTSILHDKNIITDTDKTRLNNHLRGM